MINHYIKIAILSAFLITPCYVFGATQAQLQKKTDKILEQTKIKSSINEVGKILYLVTSGNKKALQMCKDMSIVFDYSDMEEVSNLEVNVQSIDCIGYKLISSKSYALYYILNTTNGPVGCQISCFIKNRQLLFDGFKISKGGLSIVADLKIYDLFPTKLTLVPNTKKKKKRRAGN